MERTRKIKRMIVAAFVIITIAMILIAVYLRYQPQRLYPQEIREYEGENLSSISDVLENAIKGNQIINESIYRLSVSGLVSETNQYTYNEIIDSFQQYEKVVTLHCVMGWSAKILWEGILVRDLMNNSGVNTTATTVIFHAQDGYTTSLPLSYFYGRDIIIAYKMNGLVLPPEKGFPFELVAESKYGYKWIKWITQIELSDNANYKGYWESRGYSNNADLP